MPDMPGEVQAFEHHDYDPGRQISQHANHKPPRDEHPENVDRSILKDLHAKSVSAHFFGWRKLCDGIGWISCHPSRPLKIARPGGSRTFRCNKG